MKILLFGNIGTGKSTLAEKIQQLFPQFEYLAIDQFRQQYADGTWDGEWKTQDIYIQRIKPDDTWQLIECSGLGALGEKVYDRLSGCSDQILLLVLEVPVETLLQRIAHRTWDTPFPVSADHVDKTVEMLQLRYNNGTIDLLWQNMKNVSIEKYPNNTLDEQDKVLQRIQQFVTN